MFNKNLKYLELPDLPDFKAKKLFIPESTKKEELIDSAKKPILVKKTSQKEKMPEKKSKKRVEDEEVKYEHHFILRGGSRLKG